MSKQQWTPPSTDIAVSDNGQWQPPSSDVEVKKKNSLPDLPNGSKPSVTGSKNSQPSPVNTELSNQLNSALKAYQTHLTPQEKADYAKTQQAIQNKPEDRMRAATKEEVEAQHAMDGTLGKVTKSLTYLGSKASKGAVQIAKGGAWVYNHLNTGFDDTESKGQKDFWDKVDKFTDFGITKGQEAKIEDGKGLLPGLVKTGGMMAEFAPALAGGEYTNLPKTFFALQGLGQGKETIDTADPDKKLHPLVRDAFVLGSGAVNGLLMGDLGENVFGKMPAGLRKNVVTDIVANAMKEGAGKELTEGGFKKLLDNGAKDFADKFNRFGISALEKYNKSVVDLSALKAADFALKKGVDATTDKPVFNESTGDLAHSIEDIATKQAPLFAAFGSVPEATKLLPYSNFKNDIVEHVINNPGDAEQIKTKMADLGQQHGWTPEEIQATNAHVDQIADAAKKLPEDIKPEKRADGVQLLLDRDKLQGELDKAVAKRDGLDESVKDIPSKQEEYLTDKVDQANDKLRTLVTGKRTTYSKGVGEEEGLFFKITDGKKEEITENRYNLENLERTTKSQDNESNENSEKGHEKSGQSGEKSQNDEEKSGEVKRQVLTPGAEQAPTFNKEGDINHAIENGQEPQGDQQQHQNGSESGKTAEAGHSDSAEQSGKEQQKEKPRFKIKGDVVTPLEPHEHTEANELLTDHGLTMEDIENEQQERNGLSEEPAPANADEKVLQQPEDDGSGNAGKTPTGKTAQGEEESSQRPSIRQQDAEKGGGTDVKKTILTKRAYEGDVQPEVKKHLEEKGLTRKSFSQAQRSAQAKDIINKFGDDAAIMAVKNRDIDGALASSVLAQLQAKYNRMMSDLDPESKEYKDLAEKNADLIELAEKQGYLSGEFAGQLAYEYQNEELNYANIKRQVEKSTGKKLSSEQEKKVKSLSAENEKLKKQLQESEAKLIDETDKAFKLGKEEYKNETKAQKAKRIADKIRQGKLSRPGIFSAATPASVVWDGAVEVVAKSVEAGGKLADAINEGIKHIKASDWYKGLSDSKKKQAEKEFQLAHHETAGSTDLEDLQARFLNKTDNEFTTSQARDLWAYMKENYINNGTSYRDAIAKTADDLGLSWRQVSEAIVTPKTKRISDEMWKRQYDWNRYRVGAKNWIVDQNQSAIGKAWKEVSGLFRGVAVFGHGGIFMGTHAGMTLFNPTTWNKTIPAFLNGWKFAYGNEGRYQVAMEELKNSPNYVIAQRAGLKNDPDRINAEEYQKSQKYLGKLGEAGEKGFNAIKVLRQGLFDYHYNRLTAAEKQDPETAKSIAKIVNLATGATNLNLPKWVNEVSFAGGMEAARWEKYTSNPVNATRVAIKALTKPESATTEEKVFAKVWARRVGEQLATYSAALLANAAIQNYINPKNPVNLTNPDKPDFLEFKVGDIAIDPTSGMRGTGQFIYQIGKIPFEPQKELRGEDRLKVLIKKVGQRAKGKLAPFYSTVGELYSGRDFSGNVLPWSKEKPAKYAHKLSPVEYGTEKLPLPVAEAFGVFYKSYNEHGGDKKYFDNIMKAITSGAISGSTGFRINEYDEKDEKRYKMKKP